MPEHTENRRSWAVGKRTLLQQQLQQRIFVQPSHDLAGNTTAHGRNLRHGLRTKDRNAYLRRLIRGHDSDTALLVQPALERCSLDPPVLGKGREAWRLGKQFRQQVYGRHAPHLGIELASVLQLWTVD